MKIGHFVPLIACKPGFERNVSGHAQEPLKAMELLRGAGHEVHLITGRPGPDRPVMPAYLPKDVPIHFVDDGKARKAVTDMLGGHKSGFHPLRLRRQVAQVKGIVHRLGLDVVHFHGYNNTVCLAGAMRVLGMRTPTVATSFGMRRRRGVKLAFERFLVRRADAVVAATRYGRDQCAPWGVTPEVVRHGPIRDLLGEHDGSPVGERNRVLFWRDPSYYNGADIVLQAFEELAPKRPDLVFTMAVRPHQEEIEGIDDLAARHANVEIHRFPYPPGVSLARLMMESVCVLMPIRRMSIDPQLVIAESMASGVAVVATDQRSNPELITPGRSGALAPVGDARATIDALADLLSNRDRLLEMGRNAKADIAAKWNWDSFADDLVRIYERVRAGS